MLYKNQKHTKQEYQQYKPNKSAPLVLSLEFLLGMSATLCKAIFVGLFGMAVIFGATGCALFQKDKAISEDIADDDSQSESTEDDDTELDISKLEIKSSAIPLPSGKRLADSRQIATDASDDGYDNCPNPKYFPKNLIALKKLIRDESINLGEIDTSKITDMKRLFFDTEEDENDPDTEYLIPLRSEFKGIECWDVSNVKDMSLMFKGLETFNEPLNNWDVSSVEVMIAMFAGAEAFNQPLDKWNVSRVRSMKGMFYGTKAFNQPLDMWNIRNVKNMNKMFEKTPAYKQNLDAWGDKLRPDAIMKDMFKDSALEKNPPKWLKK